MPTPRKITDADREEVVRLLTDEGMGRNEISAKTGISLGSVSGIVAKAGLSFDREATRAATAARQDDLAERRSRIIDRLYRRAETLLDRLEADSFQTILKGEYGAERSSRLDFVPSRDERDLTGAIGQLAGQAARLEAVSNPQAERVKGLLGDLAEQLKQP